ncbi:MAG: DUF362 domain-containing protein [Polyangiaceae bacterium]|nr:DUF362 domain-containing protein [Polyangiaceae bacterium]
MRDPTSTPDPRRRAPAARAVLAVAVGIVACQPQPEAPRAGLAPASALGTGAAAVAPSGQVAAPATAPSASAVAAASADVVSHASTQAEPGPSVLAAGSVDGAARRARARARLGQDRSAVTVLAGGSAVELGERICEAVVPWRPPTTPVLLKPNICGYNALHKAGGDNGITGRTTDPEFVRGVVRCLRARGFTAITVADGCSVPHTDWQEVIALTGYRAMAASEQVPLVDMVDDGYFDTAPGTPGKPLRVTGMEGTTVPTLLVPKLLAEHLDHGLFLSLPKLKAHRFSVVSLAVKATQGLLMLSDRAPAHMQKWRMHRELLDYVKKLQAGDDDRAAYVRSLEVFAAREIDAFEVMVPDAVLVEGAPAMNGDGFDLLVPSAEQVAIGGTNAVAVDIAGSQFLGLWDSAELAAGLGGHRASPLVELAAERFGVPLALPALRGDGAELLRRPRPVHYKAVAPFRIDRDAP